VRYTRRIKGADQGIIEIAAGPDGEDAASFSEAFELWDLGRPLEGDCDLKLHKFDSDEGKQTFWHSSAHILGEALEGLYGAKLTHGPPTANGFFYDSYLGGIAVTEQMSAALEKKAQAIVSAKQPFERVVVTKDECLKIFDSNPFKKAMIASKLPEGSSTTVYRCGPFIDLCRGPHLPNTDRVKAFKCVKASSALWLGKVGNDDLQRVYGVAFGDKKQLKEWEELQKAAAERDHRKIGVEQELLFFDDLSPGSCFFLPHGCRIYNRLIELIRKEYFARNYTEVVTPNMYNLKLWETSGHAAKYKENMCPHVKPNAL
jgi:threonyl-tRNA synthetase